MWTDNDLFDYIDTSIYNIFYIKNPIKSSLHTLKDTVQEIYPIKFVQSPAKQIVPKSDECMLKA